MQKTILLENLYENEVNRSKEYYFTASGKGANVSRVLSQLGENVILLTQAGGFHKDLFVCKLESDGVPCSWVESQSEIRFCYTLLNRAKHTTTEIVEEAESVGLEVENEIYMKYCELLHNCHTLIISGTKAAGFSKDIYPKMVFDAKKIGKKVILDIKGEDLINCLEYQPDIIKPNYDEFASTFFDDYSFRENKVNDNEHELLKSRMTEIYELHGSTTILTRGKFGAMFWDGRELVYIPAEQITPINTTGCGDAFTAGFGSAWKTSNIYVSIQNGMEMAKRNALLIKPGVIK